MNYNLLKNVFRLGAIAGVVGTAYFSTREGENICRVCKQVNDESFGMTTGRKVKHYIRNLPRLAKPMWKTAVCGAGTIACMAVSERISYKQIAALTATCVYLTKNRDFLEQKLEEVVGKEKLEDIKKEFLTKQAPETINFPSVELTGAGDLLCIESYSGRWFRSSEGAVSEAIEMFKKQFREDKYCCMNDLYGYLNITMTQFGDEYGYVNNPDYYDSEPEFKTILLEENNFDEWFGPEGKYIKEPVLVIELDRGSYPMLCWMEV